MKKILFSLLIALSCVTAFSQSTYNNTYTKKQSEDIFATKAALSNTVAGAEGIRSELAMRTTVRSCEMAASASPRA